jgi:GNAT superfamily N-acetyltransferase
MEVVRYADRSDVRERRGELDEFPEYMNHNAMGWKYWGRLYTDFPAFQLAVLDGDALIGEVHALPLPVEDDELPTGWDEAFERGMEAGGGNVVSLLAISVKPEARGQGVPALLIEAVRNAAREAGHDGVIAPVRPTLKHEDGTYVVPGMLAPLEVRDGIGTHNEPNVWMRHELLVIESGA